MDAPKKAEDTSLYCSIFKALPKYTEKLYASPHLYQVSP